MPVIAQAAGVFEATAYRYFPDLLSIIPVGVIGVWPASDDVLPGVDVCSDPVERVAIAAECLGRNVLQIQGAVRTMIALTIARPDGAGSSPGTGSASSRRHSHPFARMSSRAWTN